MPRLRPRWPFNLDARSKSCAARFVAMREDMPPSHSVLRSTFLPMMGGAMREQTETSSKKVRGRAQRSIDLIGAMYVAAEAAQPITGRGIGYKLFTAGLIPSMARNEMQRVYRLLKEAREDGIIPWDWIVNETREIER